MSREQRIAIFVAAASALALGMQTPAPRSPQPGSPRATARPAAVAKAAATKVKVADATPEEALRTFMLAVLAQDEGAIRAITLPTPDLDWLLNSQPAPPEVIKDVQGQFDKRPIKRLKQGEKITLPRGNSYEVTAKEVGDDRAVLLPQGAPVPTRLERVAGHWKVNADPFIAARKTADAARKKAAAKPLTPQKPVPKKD